VAITNLIPVFEKVSRPNLRLITDNFQVDKLKPKKFLIIMTVIFMFCFLLQSLVSLWVTSDAFVLQDLKREKNLVQDQRDSLLKKLNEKSTPDSLANVARDLGMKPSNSINYLVMDK
jgi:hypothetical protein